MGAVHRSLKRRFLRFREARDKCTRLGRAFPWTRLPSDEGVMAGSVM
jgi:hypothetical protein